jgi:tetratricopeptide (TPR) repeat protein
MMRLVGLALACAVALGSVPAAAQDDGDADMQEARSLFVAGVAAVDAGRWADAIRSFSRAYELSGRPIALYNVAFALRALGRHVEARDAFERLLRLHGPDLDDTRRRESEGFLREERARVATLQLVGLSHDLRYGVRLDGDGVEDDGDRPLSLEVDPGDHALVVGADGFEDFLWEGDVGDGQRLEVRVTLEAIPVVSGGGGGDEDDGGILSSPVFWIVAGVLVAGGAAVAGYVLWQDAQLDCEVSRCVEL